MHCCNCDKDMVHCVCEDADERLNYLLSCPYLDSRMIIHVQEERAAIFLGKFDNENKISEDLC